MTTAEKYREIARLYGYTPDQIADMTLYQQNMLLGIDGNVITFKNKEQYERFLSRA